MINLFSSNIFISIGILIIISSVFLFVVSRFSRQFTQPLQSLIEQFRSDQTELVPPHSLFETSEVIEIGRQLQESKQVMANFNRKLEKEVEAKTKELQELNVRLAELATRDPLTGLYNRRYFDETAALVYRTNLRSGLLSALVVIDIDDFKAVNDSYGHPVGDECLKVLVKILNQHFSRESDLVARHGGEEFVLLLSGDKQETHLQQLESFRQAIAETPVLRIQMTVSIGVAFNLEQPDVSIDKLMERADEALYRSKREGRDRIRW